MRLTFLASILCSLSWALPSYITFPSDIDWVSRDSDHFQAIYRRGSDRFAERALIAAEKAYRVLTPIFPEVPEKTYLVLADFHDSTNGYALTFPYPHMVIFAAPPDSQGQLSSLDDWLDSVVLHEFVHILHVYPASGFWKVLRAVFGSVVVPNGLLPSHFHEGLAVLMETEKTEGGRGRSPLFRMYQRMAVAEGKWGTDEFASLDRLDGTASRWPHGTSAYFFGYYLHKELWERKGPKGIYDLVASESSNWPLMVNIPLKEVYGVNYPTLWEELFKKTEASAQQEIAQIRKTPLSALEFLTEDRFGKWDLKLSSDRKRLAYRAWNPEDGGYLFIHDRESKQVVKKVETNGGAEGLCLFNEPTGSSLLWVEPTSSLNTNTNKIQFYREAKDEQSTVAVQGAAQNHFHRLACDTEGKRVIAYQEWKGLGFLREFSLNREGEPTLKMEREWKIPEGSWVSGLVFNPTAIFTLRTGVHTTIYRWSAKALEPQKLWESKALYASLRPGRQESEIFAIVSFDGRDEVWAINLDTREAEKQVAVLGGVNSFDRDGKEILVTTYRHGGYDLARVGLSELPAKKIPIAMSAKVTPTPATAEKLSPVQDYSVLGSLYPRTWIPSVLFVPDGIQFGAWIPGFDISQRHYYNIIGGYDTRGLPFADVNYIRRFGSIWNAGAGVYYLPNWINSSKTFFKRWGGSLKFGGTISLLPAALGLDTVTTAFSVGPVFTRVEALGTLPANQSIGVGISLSHKRGIQKRPLSISPIAGTSLGVSHNQFFKAMGSTDNYFSTIASAEQYFEAPWWKEHVWSLGLRYGYTEGTALYNNFFQGGGELLFSQNREVFMNRGFFNGTFLARRMGVANLEYRFPIVRVERGINLLPLNLRVIHGALVTDVTTLDFNLPSYRSTSEDLFRVFFVSSGFELRSEWQFGFYVPAQIRFGFYHAFSEYGESLYVNMGLEASL